MKNKNTTSRRDVDNNEDVLRRYYSALKLFLKWGRHDDHTIRKHAFGEVVKALEAIRGQDESLH